MQIPDETSITELTILPDGRIFVFGLSRQILHMLKDLDFSSPDLQRRLEQVQSRDNACLPCISSGQEPHGSPAVQESFGMLSKELER